MCFKFVPAKNKNKTKVQTASKVPFCYLSHFRAQGFRWGAPALCCLTRSTSPVTGRGADSAEAAQTSHVMTKTKRRPAIWALLSAPRGSPEPCPQRPSVCLGTAPPPVEWGACPERKSKRRPRSCAASRRGLGSERAAGAGTCLSGLGPCFLAPCLSHCPRPCCWRSCCCPAPPTMEPVGVPRPELFLQFLSPAGTLVVHPLEQMSTTTKTFLYKLNKIQQLHALLFMSA